MSNFTNMWDPVPLSHIIAELESGVSVNGEDRPAASDEPGVLKVSSVSGGRFHPRENKAVVPGDRHRVAVSPRRGDLLISRANTYELVGACGYVEHDFDHLFLPDKLWRVLLRDPTRDDTRWLLHVLNSPAVREELRARATGTSGSMKNISKDNFLGIRVPHPPFDEQKRIVEILDRWDSAIKIATDLGELKSKLKVALADLLLTGKKRFGGPDWSCRTFGSFLIESRDPGSDGSVARKLTIRLYGRGVIPKIDTRPGSAATQYYRRRAGQFIYSKLDFLNGAFGIIPPSLDGYESTLDLPAFDVDESIDPRWLLHFVTREGFYRSQLGLANGGRKARRVNPRDLLNLKVCVPDKSEQTKIANALAAADQQVELLHRLVMLWTKQKQRLMEKLLSGIDQPREEAA